ncbi:MAG: cell shape-determining protein, partial [Flavobacteriaceae bacterium]|nr:cell shape-determining protein [Flavobacteriaceae bacterium]
EDNIELNDVGYLMALTANSDINNFAINKFQNQFGENGAFRLISPYEMQDSANSPKVGLFSDTDDFVSLTETSRKFPVINEIELKSKEHYDELIEKTKQEEFTIPLFIKQKSGNLEIISSYSKENKVEKGYKLVYLGKPVKV